MKRKKMTLEVVGFPPCAYGKHGDECDFRRVKVLFKVKDCNGGTFEAKAIFEGEDNAIAPLDTLKEYGIELGTKFVLVREKKRKEEA